ncbi:MAG: RluA family pseudouridine synthase [Armatimonadetes bacterium]|nr:RluA family pseudouridine synthase [Armatimonadota bacterium]
MGRLVVAEEAGQRVDQALRESLPELSRTAIQRLVESGGVAVNSRATRPGYRLSRGEVVTWTIPEAPAAPSALVPEAIPLTLLYQDEHLLVLDKPRGLVVHPAPGHATGTLVQAVLAHAGEDLPDTGSAERPGIVHRLDRDTTGLMVVALSERGMAGLRAQVEARTMERRYLALVRGRPSFAAAEVDAPIGRHPTDRKRMAVIRPGAAQPARAARTDLRVLERFSGYALLEARLQTGRTHQVRVHCAYARVPVVGDSLYGPPSPERDRTVPEEVRAALQGLGGQALHAWLLGFDHPITGERLFFTTPLPDDFAVVLQALGSRVLLPGRGGPARELPVLTPVPG